LKREYACPGWKPEETLLVTAATGTLALDLKQSIEFCANNKVMPIGSWSPGGS
jgi:hypothetical protein